MRHQPGLDGLRGLAVAAVLAFHAGAPWMVGGYLGVSTFFTLSGFLITGLLLDRPELGRFWARRARRLLPASLAFLAGVAALAPALATDAQLRSLRVDLLSALAYVANWRFVLGDRTYAELFSAPSPVLHLWSLAIEEQLYLVVPLVVVFVRRSLLPWVLGAGVVGSVVLSLVSSESTAYWSTGVRAGELLVGCLLAVVLAARRPVTDVHPFIRAAGVVGLAGLALAWATVGQGTDWLYRGGFVGHALVSAVVIVAAIADGGPVRAVLSFPPLQAVGRISYGLYLVHWPVFVWMDSPVVVELAVSLALAVTSYVLLEQPIRRERVRVPVAVAPVAMVTVAAVVLLSTMSPPRDPFVEAVVATPTTALLPTAPRVAVFGDSTALRTGYGLLGHGWATGAIDVRSGGTHVGCPIVRGGEVDYVVTVDEPDDECDWPTRWRSVVAAERLDVALVQAGPWDVTERRLEGSDEWISIGDAVFDDTLRDEVSLAVDVLSADGAVVLWLTSPRIRYDVEPDHPINDPSRVDRLNAILREIDAERDEMVLLDVAPRVEAMGRDGRPDGVHLTDDAAVELAPWLAERIVEAAARR